MIRTSLELLLKTLNVQLNAFAVREIEPDRSFDVKLLDSVICYFVVRGSGYFEHGGESLPVAEHSIVVVPPDTAKRTRATDPAGGEISATLGCNEPAGSVHGFRARSGKASLVLGCATIAATCAGGFGLFDDLTEPLLLDGDPLLAASFAALADEIAKPTLGSAELTHCLIKQAIILVVRHHLSAYPDSPALHRLGDERLVRAISAMLDAPWKAHTIDQLAKLAGMSRSAFMRHFTVQYDTTPGEYLLGIRMHSAARLLRITDMKVKSVASKIGYTSRSHFSRAFRDAFGVDPSGYREQCRREAEKGEGARLAALRKYEILDTPPDGSFDRVTAIAATLFSVPIAIVSLVDKDRIWFKSHHGLDVSQVDRSPGLCASAILQDRPYIVEDATNDVRALANPLVASEFGLRFYAAAQLRTRDGFNLGTLCVIDRVPRDTRAEQIEQLEQLAAIVMDQMELRLEARRAFAELANFEHRDCAIAEMAGKFSGSRINGRRLAQPV